MQDTRDRKGSKQACQLLLKGEGRATGSSTSFHMASTPRNGWESRSHQPLSMLLHSSCSVKKDGDICPRCLDQDTTSTAVPIPLGSTCLCSSLCDHRSFGEGLATRTEGLMCLIQCHSTVPSGWRRKEGRNLPSTCWKGFKTDFTPNTGGSEARKE